MDIRVWPNQLKPTGVIKQSTTKGTKPTEVEKKMSMACTWGYFTALMHMIEGIFRPTGKALEK